MLVVSRTALNDILPVVNVLPVTSRKANRRIHPNEALLPAGAAGLTLESAILYYQIRTLDGRRIGRLFGMLDDVTQRQAVIDALNFQLDMA